MTTISNIEFRLVRNLDALSEDQVDGQRMIEMSRLFRRYGCGLLLATLDLDDFVDALYKSGIVYRTLLEAKASVSPDDAYYLCRARGTPLLDALAIDAVDLAQEIASHMANDFVDGMEFPNAYYYFGALMAISTSGEGPGIDQAYLLRYEEALQGLPCPRFEMLRAIVESDSEAFDAALTTRLDEVWDSIAEKRDNEALLPEEDLTEANVDVEGLALARLARRHGLTIRREYPLIPDVVLGPARTQSFPLEFRVWG